MASVAPAAVYSERLSERKARLAEFESKTRALSHWRLFAFVLAGVDIWFTIQGPLKLWTLIAPLALFVALVWRQSGIERQAECARRAIRFNEGGIARVEDRWHDRGEKGERFADPHHPYSGDLDLFGHASLFQLLSTARTRSGEARLASWLTSASPVETLRERHVAIDELRPLIDLREQIAVLGDDLASTVDPEHLAKWGSAPAHPFPASRRLIALILSIVAAVILAWWVGTGFIDLWARRALVALVVAEGSFYLSLRKDTGRIVEEVGRPAHDLELLSQILRTLESQRFQSPLLARVRGALDVEGHPASERIAKLRRLMDTLDSRDNIIIKAIDGPLLWTIQTAMAIEGWRSANGRYIAGWLDAVAEIEALSALANYAFEHPADPFPEFSADTAFAGDELGHPLIPDATCVRNSVSLTAPVQLYVVSGSNMSGKSTLLRAVGVNAVLALAGAPVRAKRLRLSRLALGASIRTMDSLEEGHSRFMAEIVRLKQILDLPSPALFLLDELLHGTNSHDRSIGAEGLIRALLAKGAIGLATTHDLSLSRVAGDLAPKGINVHFEDRLDGGRLVFDYRMKPGIVTRSNALDLMRAVGLDV
ncbi:MAG: mismatch repair protein [Acidobacteriota bacterium]|nr:mismatch repair protein [Acidobacteriota bacterium]